MKKLGLLPKLIIGLIAGIVVGKIGYVPLLRIMLTFNGVFGNFLQFVIHDLKNDQITKICEK